MIEKEYQEYIATLTTSQANNFALLAKHAKISAEEKPELTLRILKQVNVLQSKHKVELLDKLEDKEFNNSKKEADEINAEGKYEQLKATFELRQLKNYVFLARQVKQASKQDPEVALLLLEDVEYLQQLQKDAIKREAKQKLLAEQKKAELANVESPIEQIKEATVPKNHLKQVYRSLFNWLVIVPFLCFVIYQVLIAAPRYESQAQVIVQQPDSMATMDTGMALLSGMGVPTGNSDTELVKAYIYSNDMLKYLDEKLDLRSHYSQTSIDYFSRIHADNTREELLEYYYQRVKVDIYEKSGVITIYAQGFDSVYTQKLAKTIVKRAEWYINSIGHQLANAQLGFIQNEHANIEARFSQAQTNLLNFQQQYKLLDPMAEGAAMQQITYTLEGQIAVKQTELKTIQAIMSAKAPQVRALKNELDALKAQLKSERSKLAQSGKEDLAVSELLAKFTDYKVKMELALQAYTSSQISLEKSRIEAYRQIKYLVIVENATLSESNKYPQILYNLALFFVVNVSIFAIGRIIFSVIKELK